MDQAVALHARPAHAVLLDFAEHTETQVPWDPESEGLTLLVTDTRVAHQLTDGGYAARRADCESAARALGVGTLREVQGRPELLDGLRDEQVRRRARHVLTEMDRVDVAVSALERGDLASIGPLLDDSHDSLRDDFEVSCPELDLVVDTCRGHDALGARMTGGGFGGSAIALLPMDRVRATTRHLVRAFGDRGWKEPRFLTAPASSAARRLSNT
jgi:galactokinase